MKFHFPRGADWMTLEESADRKMDQMLIDLMPVLEESCSENTFFPKIDSFYEEALRIVPRTGRAEFDRITLLVIEAFMRKKFHENAFFKYQSWKFDLHRKNKKNIEIALLPVELQKFIQEKKPFRVEGILDFHVKKQSDRWFNPYVEEVGTRPIEIYEMKILFKELSHKILKGELITSLNQTWNQFLNDLKISENQYIQSENFIFSSRKIKTLSGETIEFLLIV